MRNLSGSVIAVCFTLFFIYSSILINQRWNSGEVISNDMNLYYIYLPATFIYHDISFNYINDKLPKDVRDRSWTLTTEDGKHHVSKMSCGYAIMLMPFFLVAHLFQSLTGGNTDGYNSTYCLFICVASFFYLMAGLFYQRRILLYFFDELTTAFTLIALGLATNIYMYSTFSFTQTHIFSFCLFSILIWKTIEWHQQPLKKNSIIIGLLLGLITIVRPNNIIIAVFFLLYNVCDKNSFSNKFELLKKNKKQLLYIVIFLIIGIAPQLIIWKIQTGHFIYYSYQTEKFYFNHPHILQGLFSFRNGLFIYTPIMLFIIPGFILSFKQKTPFGVASLVYFIFTCYIVFSWWCWWYGGSFGMRAMIESYAIFALPFGCAIKEIGEKKILKKYVLPVILILFIVLNQFQTLQSQSSLLHYYDMSYQAYIKIFGRLTWPSGYEESLIPPDLEFAKLGKPERSFSESFPFLKGKHKAIITLKAANGKFVCADRNLEGKLIADRSKAVEWERFELTIDDFWKCSLLSWQNKYVTVESTPNSELIAKSDRSHEKELFSFEKLNDNKFAIKDYNNKYVKPDSQNTFILEANSDSITNKEIFEILSY